MTGFQQLAGNAKDYDRDYAMDVAQLAAFLKATQEDTAAGLQLGTDSAREPKVSLPLANGDQLTRCHPRAQAWGQTRQVRCNVFLQYSIPRK